MNTEASQDQTVPETTGVRLRQARESLGLTQQTVAERLCLKVSTIRDIEEDKAQANLASTFHRGYIRSYAKLVHLPKMNSCLCWQNKRRSERQKLPRCKVFHWAKSIKNVMAG